MLSDEFIQQAIYLHEGAVPNAEQRARWCVRIARGDWGLFEKRLAWGLQTQPPDLGWTRPPKPGLLRPNFVTAQAYQQLQEWLAKRLSLIDIDRPVGARLAAIWTGYWARTVGLFFERLAADRLALEATFGIWEFLVAEVETSLSDYHDRGQSVIAVTFASGVRIVYKPKSLASDVALGQVIDWCNGKGLTCPLKRLRILARDGYGWMEHFGTGHNHPVCASGAATPPSEGGESQSSTFGRLMALLYGLRATDCHRYNVLNDGTDAVLVDAETLMHPDARPFTVEPSLHPLYDSVYRMGMLTRWEGDLDMGALAALPPAAASAVMAGFEEVYRLLLNHRSEFIASEGFRRFKSLPVRFIFRATKIYDTILRQSLQPECLENGIERSIVLDQLSRAFLVAKEKPYSWSLLEAETEALAVGDIPYFATTRDSTALPPISSFFVKSGYDRCLEQLFAFSEDDLAFQKSVIELSFRCKLRPNAEMPVPGGPVPTPQELLEEASAIGRELKSKAVRTRDGAAHWITPSQTAPRFDIHAVGDDLYSGRCGIAFFLAALYRATGNPLDRDLGLAAISGIRAEHLGIGGMVGLGSIVYALARIARFLERPSLLDDAAVFASRITSDRIQTDFRFDVMSGAAGAILGMLSLPQLPDQALECGRHIAKSYEPHLTGFAHGAAGIAHAMLRLFEVTNEIEFRRTAERAIAFEQKLFSKEHGNWPDLRSMPPDYPVRWCHGAAGIGLGRLGSGSELSDAGIKLEIDAAIQATLTHPGDGVDHLCCGNLGRIELLLTAGLSEARERMGRVLARKRLSGGYTLNAELQPGTMVPGLFQGLAGVGYEMLRLREPEQFPSVLLMD